MNLGFTGTRSALTFPQVEALRIALDAWGPGYFRHGDCIGADATAHMNAQAVGSWHILVFPPEDPKYRAWCGGSNVSIQGPRPYIERNKFIVDHSDRMLAMPDGPERLRSGTWSTVRYAAKTGVDATVVMPDGTVMKR